MGRCGLPRPVHQHAHGLSLGRGRVGVKQQHQRGFQPLSPMHGEQAHGVCIGPLWRFDATGLERAHQGIGRGVTSAIHLQNGGQQGLQIGQHTRAQGVGRSRRKAGQHIAVLVNGVQRVVRRECVEPAFVLGQNSSNAF